MGNEINGKLTFREVAQNWMGVCANLNNILPFMGATLWQVGPLPWMMNSFSNSISLFSSSNMGAFPIGDQFINTNKTEKEDKTPKTDEENIQERIDKKKEAREKKEAIESYQKTRTVVMEYVKTLKEKMEDLSDGEEKNKLQDLVDVLEATLEECTDIKSNTSKKKEDIIAAQEKLQRLINEHKAEMREHNISLAKKDAYLDIPEDFDTHKKLKTALSAGDDPDYGGVLKGEAAKEWNDDIDLINLVGAWKLAENDNKSFIMAILDGNGENKTALVRELHNQIINIAEDIDTKKIPKELKAQLEEDIEILKSYRKDSDTESSVILENKDAYSKAFNNLYQAIRTAKAEIAQAELNEKLEAIGALRESDKEDILTQNTQSLKSLGIVRAYDAEAFSETVSAGSTTTSSTTATPVTGSETPAVSSAENNKKAPISTAKYNDKGKEIGYKLYEGLHGLGSGAAKVQVMRINRENVVDVIRAFEEKSPNENIITYLSNDNFSFHIPNRIVKAVMRQALHLGLNASNCEAFKVLQDMFGAKGKPAYGQDGVTPKQGEGGTDTFEFTNPDGIEGRTYTGVWWEDKANDVYAKLIALVEEIEKLEK